MNIKPLITKRYTTLDAYTPAWGANELLQATEAVVLMDNHKPIGILTLSDLAMKSDQLVIDCFRERPAVSCTDSIDVVLNVMKTTGSTVLPVTFQNNFFGLISQAQILFYLHEIYEKEKLALLAAAHDLRSPIASFRLLGTLLKADPALDRHQHLLNKLSQTCDYAETIVQNILGTELSQHEPIVLVNESLDPIVNACIDSLADRFAEKGLIVFKQLHSNQIIKADRPKLARAINNILWNSIKFTRAEGTVRISTLLAPGGQALLMVKDTGIGVPQNMQEKIFDKFTRARRPGTAGEPTTGLGLYLTKMIIESHGGSIRLESDGQTGSCFTVSLPVDNHITTPMWGH